MTKDERDTRTLAWWQRAAERLRPCACGKPANTYQNGVWTCAKCRGKGKA